MPSFGVLSLAELRRQPRPERPPFGIRNALKNQPPAVSTTAGWVADEQSGLTPRGPDNAPQGPYERHQYMSWSPPWPFAALASLGFSATKASLVSSSVATLAALARAVLATLVGSMTPALTRSS